ncbi:hypothetical protein [Tabrizicola sp.]|uniref:hypothetical protein n=1 Tax=Tabrizicola sp. TaxID=2005166 RepID=UPI003F3188E1
MTFWKALVLGFALSISAVAAQELSDEDRAAMTARVDAFKATFAAGDMGAVFDYMPPKLIQALAAQSGMDEATLIELTKAEIEQTMAVVTFDSWSMDLEAATYQMTPDGSRGYMMIPTEALMTIEGAGQIKAVGETLVFEDEGKWYLLRIGEPAMNALFQTAYPEFAGITFKPEVMEPVAE